MKILLLSDLHLEFYKDDIPSSGWVHVSYVSQENNRKRSLKFDGKEYTTL